MSAVAGAMRRAGFRRTTARFALSAIAMLLALNAGGCGSEADKQFAADEYPFSFTYPGDWKLTRDAAFRYGSGSGERSLSIVHEEPYDQVTITQYKLKKTLPKGVNGNRREVDRIVAQLTKQAKGNAGEAKKVEYGGIPGYAYVIEYPAASATGGRTKNGPLLRNDVVFLFKGNDEFQINCQSSPKNRDELKAGCRQILETLKFVSPAAP